MKKKKAALKKWSVLLLYPDYSTDDYGQETYYAWVKAKNPKEAVTEAQLEAQRHNDSAIEEPSDFFPLLCIPGHIKGELIG